MANMNPNTDKLIQAKKAQSEQKRNRVLSVLNEMIKNGEIISKAEICRRANVSKPFIYSDSNGLLDTINKAMNAQNEKAREIYKVQKGISETSKDKVIESLKRRNALLEDENKRLRNENSILLGKLASK